MDLSASKVWTTLWQDDRNDKTSNQPSYLNNEPPKATLREAPATPLPKFPVQETLSRPPSPAREITRFPGTMEDLTASEVSTEASFLGESPTITPSNTPARVPELIMLNEEPRQRQRSGQRPGQRPEQRPRQRSEQRPEQQRPARRQTSDNDRVPRLPRLAAIAFASFTAAIFAILAVYNHTAIIVTMAFYTPSMAIALWRHYHHQPPRDFAPVAIVFTNVMLLTMMRSAFQMYPRGSWDWEIMAGALAFGVMDILVDLAVGTEPLAP